MINDQPTWGDRSASTGHSPPAACLSRPTRQTLALAILLAMALAALVQHNTGRGPGANMSPIHRPAVVGQPAATTRTPTPAGGTPNRAGLVIQHGDGRLLTTCVAFAEPEISGMELLERSGIAYVSQGGGLGAAVCQIDGEGCGYPAEDCFCRCRGAACTYWAYARLRAGRWDYSAQGASSVRVRPGDVEGWAWGAGSVERGVQPALLSFDQICAAQGDGPPLATGAPTEPTGLAGPALQPGHGGVAQAAPTPTAARPAGGAGGAGAGGQSSSLVDYLAFGALALVLAGGIVVVLLRRRSGA